MIYIIIVLGMLIIILNAIIGHFHTKLWDAEIYKTTKRFSLKRLRKSDCNVTNEFDYYLLKKAKLIYVFFLGAFYLELFLIALQFIF